uniref:Vacuolar protein sorting-associated protein 16 homolog n=1 Tax=Saimiri boliviensis boliviensis TaxID=39432 RepID=A0A2K6UG24_SAIBB
VAHRALLLEAQKEYEKENQKADEYLWEIQELGRLTQAVQQCIEAAGHEYQPDMLKSLLRAASFGKCFLDRFPPDSFVHMCQDLHVLNAVRDYHIGIPLTYSQHKQLTIQVLLDRIVLQRLYSLAIRVGEYLHLPEVQGISRILARWAYYKVQQKDVSDEDVAGAINQKLGDTPAYGCGCTELAINLLEYEPCSGDQVPLLLKMKRSKLAIESGDTDLVFTVLLHLKNELNWGNSFHDSSESAHGPEFLPHLSQLCCRNWIEAAYAFYKAKNEFAAKATEDQILEDKLGCQFLDLSLRDTITALILGGHNKRAEQLARDFRIPVKRLWWLKLTALADLEDWEELEKFSKNLHETTQQIQSQEVCFPCGS